MNASPVRQKKRGFTLTEIAIVLGIIGLILGAIWVAADAVYNNLRVSHANTAILQIAQAVRGAFATETNTTGLTPDRLIGAKLFPSDLLNSVGTGLTDPWSGGVTTVAPSTDGAPGPAGFTITMSLVPIAACINLVTAVGGPNHDTGLYYVKGIRAAVAGIGGTGTTAAGAAITAPVTPDLATTACAGGAATGTVEFGFNVKS